MAWTSLTFAYGSVLTSTKMTQLQANFGYGTGSPAPNFTAGITGTTAAFTGAVSGTTVTGSDAGEGQVSIGKTGTNANVSYFFNNGVTFGCYDFNHTTMIYQYTFSTQATVFSGSISGTTGTFSGAVTSNSPTAGIGYAAGAGGTVTQGTSNTTAVTLNKICGNITTFGGQYNTDSVTIFTLNNSAITGSGACVVAASFNGDASSGRLSVQINPMGNGIASVAIRNHSVSNITETLLINFAVIPKVNS